MDHHGPVLHAGLVVALAVSSMPVAASTMIDRVQTIAAPDDVPLGDPAIRAAELFRDGRYAEAAAAFEQAYEATSDPAFLFGRAQALRRAGNCGAAIDVFEEFVASGPPEPDRQEAERVIAECREILRPRTPAADPVPLVDEPDEPAPESPASDPPPSAWYRDVAGGVLLGSGLGVAVAGGAVYGAAFARAQDRSETEAQYERRDRSVQRMTIAGATLLAVGGALLIGSAIRYAIVARRGRKTTGARFGAPFVWRF